MIYTPKNSTGLKLITADGEVLKYACEFNDETFEVKQYVIEDEHPDGTKIFKIENGQVAVKSDIYPGAKMVKR